MPTRVLLCVVWLAREDRERDFNNSEKTPSSLSSSSNCVPRLWRGHPLSVPLVPLWPPFVVAMMPPFVPVPLGTLCVSQFLRPAPHLLYSPWSGALSCGVSLIVLHTSRPLRSCGRASVLRSSWAGAMGVGPWLGGDGFGWIGGDGLGGRRLSSWVARALVGGAWLVVALAVGERGLAGVWAGGRVWRDAEVLGRRGWCGVARRGRRRADGSTWSCSVALGGREGVCVALVLLVGARAMEATSFALAVVGAERSGGRVGDAAGRPRPRKILHHC